MPCTDACKLMCNSASCAMLCLAIFTFGSPLAVLRSAPCSILDFVQPLQSTDAAGMSLERRVSRLFHCGTVACCGCVGLVQKVDVLKLYEALYPRPCRSFAPFSEDPNFVRLPCQEERRRVKYGSGLDLC